METNSRSSKCIKNNRANSSATSYIIMKANFFLIILSIVLAMLLGYLAFNIAEGKENDIACGVISSISFIATLLPIMGIDFDNKRISINIKLLSCIFFVFSIIINFCFAFFKLIMPYYFIVNGIILIVFLYVFHKTLTIICLAKN